MMGQKKFEVKLTYKQICIIKHRLEKLPEADHDDDVLLDVFLRKQRYLKAYFDNQLEIGCDWVESQRDFEEREAAENEKIM